MKRIMKSKKNRKKMKRLKLRKKGIEQQMEKKVERNQGKEK